MSDQFGFYRPTDRQELYRHGQRLDALERKLNASVSGRPAPNPTSGRSPVMFVAASNAADWEKAAADYVCDGTADHVEILAAIADANDVWDGCPVWLSSGNFYVSDQIIAPFWVPIRGAGRKVTFIYWDGSGAWAGPCLELDDVADVFIDTRGSGTGATALQFGYQARDLWVAADGRGVLAQGSTGLLADHVEPWVIGGNFLEVAANDSLVRDINFAGGWHAGSLALLVHGIGGGSTTIEGCMGGAAGTAIQIDSFASYTLFSGNRWIAGTTYPTEPLILVDGDNNDIVGNAISCATAGVVTAVKISASGDRNVVANNTFRNIATNVNNLGTGSVITPNVSL